MPAECLYYGSFCGDTGCPVHGQPQPDNRPRATADAEQAVLDAMWAIPDGTLRHALHGDHWVKLPDTITNALRAEEARRVAK